MQNVLQLSSLLWPQLPFWPSVDVVNLGFYYYYYGCRYKDLLRSCSVTIKFELEFNYIEFQWQNTFKCSKTGHSMTVSVQCTRTKIGSHIRAQTNQPYQQGLETSSPRNMGQFPSILYYTNTMNYTESLLIHEWWRLKLREWQTTVNSAT